MLVSLTLVAMATVTQALEVANEPFAQEDPSFYTSQSELPKDVRFPSQAFSIPSDDLGNAGKILSVVKKPGSNQATAIGAEHGLYLLTDDGQHYASAYPADARYSWAPRQVSAVVYDSEGRLWFGAENGIGVWDGTAWSLYTGAEGLPYKNFTCAAAGKDGAVWFGTKRGAIRFDGKTWNYRAGRRWLLDDHVTGIVVEADGSAWIATKTGFSHIKRETWTLEKKSDYFIDQVETRHNRDGYITNWDLKIQGDVSSAVPQITDNDGLYTAMYGAAMAFKYAATGDEKARALAERSFVACKRLVDVVPESMKGFPARVLIPADWKDPVNEQYGAEYNAKKQERDPFWKQITPRFPLSEDGKYMWKNDTSSDELAGHYFFYAIYYDLVAKTAAEKQAAQDVVRDITDHLIRNDFALVDHDGKPTRWAWFGPDALYSAHGWAQVGLNSMMMLSFLNVAGHVTGDTKYGDVAAMLRDEHHYHINSMVPRPTFPPANVVPWDNNLALLSFYGLLNYEKDPELWILYRQALEDLWQFSSKQKNALWNYIYAAGAKKFTELAKANYFDGAFPEAGPYTGHYIERFSTWDAAEADSLETLQRMPLRLLGWPMENSHRLDVEPDPTP
ncbi:MAG: hypothetical protein L3K26_01345, partial [Candidatus Hydrogenedentes bacterium]|nr:hypothetical protein [Candidatus Hydrogenedentota bacterium]